MLMIILTDTANTKLESTTINQNGAVMKSIRIIFTSLASV